MAGGHPHCDFDPIPTGFVGLETKFSQVPPSGANQAKSKENQRKSRKIHYFVVIFNVL